MKRPRWFVACLLLLCTAGCGWWNGEEQEADDDFPELTTTSEAAPEPGEPQPLVGTPLEGTPADGELRLQLRVGDRFPLLKSIEQTLKQQTPNGLATSRSELSLMMVITVEAAEAVRTRLSVRYERIRYAHDIAGQRVDYDSATPPPVLPDAVQAYHGLANNGFSVWIGADNRIVEVVDFHAFLQRCAQHLAPDQRESFLQQLAASQGDEGVANFIDDVVGLLPYAPSGNERQIAVKVGDRWTKERPIFHPLPMQMKTFYSLESMNDQVAEIDIYGTITPSTATTYGSPQPQNDSQKLTIRDGRCKGNCTVDVKTGLPIAARIVRDLDMTVHSPGGVEFDQQKQIVTTIQTYRGQGLARFVGDSAVQTANGVEQSPAASYAAPADFRESSGSFDRR